MTKESTDPLEDYSKHPCIEMKEKLFHCKITKSILPQDDETIIFCTDAYPLCKHYIKHMYEIPNLVGRKKHNGNEFMR